MLVKKIFHCHALADTLFLPIGCNDHGTAAFAAMALAANPGIIFSQSLKTGS
jgi:hypothetical protein